MRLLTHLFSANPIQIFGLVLFGLFSSVMFSSVLLMNLATTSSYERLPVLDRSAESQSAKAVGNYRKDVMAFVKRSKNKTNNNLRFGAVVDLCMLHCEIVNDARFSRNKQLQGFRAIAADRLSKCKREIEIEIKREVRRLARLETSKDRSGSQAVSNSSMPTEEITYEALIIENMQTLTQISGGPINLWGYTGGNFGPNGICDYGPDLVRLIENTISPDSWQNNGGTGVIHYYRPLRILVVSASSQVHDNLSDLLEQLK